RDKPGQDGVRSPSRRPVSSGRIFPKAPPMDLHLDGKNVLIAGGSKGIGRAAAEGLAGEGCNLVLVARTQKDLDTAKAALLAKFNTRVETVAADLSEGRNVDRLAREFPDVDILVNNAGAIPGGNRSEIHGAKWRAARARNGSGSADMRACLD